MAKLVEMSYDMAAVGSDADALFLEKAIRSETDEELKAALFNGNSLRIPANRAYQYMETSLIPRSSKYNKINLEEHFLF